MPIQRKKITKSEPKPVREDAHPHYSQKDLKQFYEIVEYDLLDRLQNAEVDEKVKFANLGYFHKTQREHYFSAKKGSFGNTKKSSKPHPYLHFQFKLSKTVKD